VTYKNYTIIKRDDGFYAIYGSPRFYNKSYRTLTKAKLAVNREIKVSRGEQQMASSIVRRSGIGNPSQIIPASGIIIDRKRGKVHIINPGKIQNIAQGFFDSNGVFHPIRASGDYDSSRVGESKKKKKPTKKRAKATKKSSKKKVTKKKGR